MGKVTSDVVGRSVRPSSTEPLAWPWAKGHLCVSIAESKALGVDDRALGPWQGINPALRDHRATVVAVDTDKHGVMVTIENEAGEVARVALVSVGLVPRDKAGPEQLQALTTAHHIRDSRIQDATRMLVHYLTTIGEAAGVPLSGDASTEIGCIAPMIVDAAVAAVEAKAIEAAAGIARKTSPSKGSRD